MNDSSPWCDSATKAAAVDFLDFAQPSRGVQVKLSSYSRAPIRPRFDLAVPVFLLSSLFPAYSASLPAPSTVVPHAQLAVTTWQHDQRRRITRHQLIARAKAILFEAEERRTRLAHAEAALYADEAETA